VIVVGLTGSIGMGKSTTAQLFAEEGVPVFEADAEVRALYGKGGLAVPLVAEAFPGAVKEGAVDRAALSALVVGDDAALRRLEALVHPLVREARGRAVDRARRAGSDIVVLDIPLLFETASEGEVDVVVVVSAPSDVQKERVLARPGMDEGKLAALLARQVPDAEKRRRADFVIDTGKGIEPARLAVRAILRALRAS